MPAYPEIRPANTPYNQTPGQPPAPAYRGWTRGFGPYYDRISGACTGTTEQILEWAALKWGLDQLSCAPAAASCRELVKAAAVQESDWYQRVRGDYEACTQSWCWPSPGYFGTTYQTYGITGVKRTAWGGSWSQSHASTPFAADWYGAAIRAYYDGAIPWASGTRGDIWKAVAAWYCGCDTGWPSYAANVQRSLQTREWAQSWFPSVRCSTNCVP